MSKTLVTLASKPHIIYSITTHLPLQCSSCSLSYFSLESKLASMKEHLQDRNWDIFGNDQVVIKHESFNSSIFHWWAGLPPKIVSILIRYALSLLCGTFISVLLCAALNTLWLTFRFGIPGLYSRRNKECDMPNWRRDPGYKLYSPVKTELIMHFHQFSCTRPINSSSPRCILVLQITHRIQRHFSQNYPHSEQTRFRFSLGQVMLF